MKNTKARNLILDFLKQSKLPVSVDEIFLALKNEDINLSTIYRNLATFEKHSLIKKQLNPDRVAVYEILSQEHSHILQCNVCGKQTQLDFCPFEKLNKKIKKDYNFNMTEQNTILFGVCDKCKK